MRTTSEKEQVIQSRSDKDLSESSARCFKFKVGEKRMSVITSGQESGQEVLEKLKGKFAEEVTPI